MSVIHKFSSQTFGGRDAATFKGNKGDLIFDPASMTFYYHDGVQIGGIPINTGTSAAVQSLTLTGTSLSISGGNAVDLSSILSNIDYNTLLNKPTIPADQTLSLIGSTLAISNGNTVDLSVLAFSGDYNDLINKPAAQPFQTLSLSGNTITISESGSSIDLTPILGGTSGPVYDELTDLTDVILPTGWSQGDVLTINASGFYEFLPPSASSETLTSLALAANVLTYTDELGNATNIDLSLYLDDTNLARLVSGTVAANGMATFTRDDATTFTVDFSTLVGATDTVINALTFDSATSTLTAGVSDGNTYSVLLPSVSLPDGTAPFNQLYWVEGPNTWFAAAGSQYFTFAEMNDANTTSSDASVESWYKTNGTLMANGNVFDINSAPAYYHEPSNRYRVYQPTSKTWTAVGVDKIDELSDVDTSSTPPANNDILSWDGTNWVPTAPVFGSGVPAGANGDVQFNNSGVFGANSELNYDFANASLKTPKDIFSVVATDEKYNITATKAPLDTTFAVATTQLTSNQAPSANFNHYSEHNGVIYGARLDGAIFASTDGGATFSAVTLSYTPALSMDVKWVRTGDQLWGMRSDGQGDIYLSGPTATATTYFGPKAWYGGTATAFKTKQKIPGDYTWSLVYGFSSGKIGHIYPGIGAQNTEITPAGATNTDAVIDVASYFTTSSGGEVIAAICDNGTALFSTDGATYSIVATGKPFAGAKLIGISNAVDPSKAGFYVVYIDGTVESTTDFVTFTAKSPAFTGQTLSDAVGYGVAGSSDADLYYSTIFALDTGSNIYQSQDFGDTWVLQDTIAPSASSLHMDHPSTYGIKDQSIDLYALADGGEVSTRKAILISSATLQLNGDYLKVEHPPIEDLDIANKKYVDDRSVPDYTGVSDFTVLTTVGGTASWLDMSTILSYGQVPLSAHYDVNAFSPANGEVLTWDNGQWVSQAPAAGGAMTIGDLTNVDGDADETGADAFLVRDAGGIWRAGGVGINTLADVSTTLAYLPSAGDVLTWDPTVGFGNWVPKPPAAGGTDTVITGLAFDSATDTLSASVSDGNTYSVVIPSSGLPNGTADYQQLIWGGGQWNIDIAAAGSIFSFSNNAIAESTLTPATNGGTLYEGALYWNDTEQEIRVYTGFEWLSFANISTLGSLTNVDSEVDDGSSSREFLTWSPLANSFVLDTSSIDWLGDVDTSTAAPANGEVLTWDSSIGFSGMWVPKPAASGSSIPDGTAGGQQLYWNGTAWAVNAPASMNIWTASSDSAADTDWTSRGGTANRAGRIYYNASQDNFRYHTGTAWKDFGGVSITGDLNDVNAAAPQNGQVLVWDSTAGEYQPKYAVPGTNVLGTNSNNDYHLTFVGGISGTKTINTDSNSDLTYNPGTNTLSVANNKVIDVGDSIGELADVDTTSTPPSNNDVLSWDGTNWTPAPGGTVISDGTEFGQLLWWTGATWSASAGISNKFQFDGYTGRIISRGINQLYDSANNIGPVSAPIPVTDSYSFVDASSNTTVYPTQTNAALATSSRVEIEISNGSQVTFSGITMLDESPTIISGDGFYMLDIASRGTAVYGRLWRDRPHKETSNWRPLGLTTVSNNSMPITPWGFATVGDLFAFATEGMIVVRDGTEYISSTIPAVAVSAFPATFPIYKGGSLLASMTFTSPTDTIFDVTIHSADEVKVYYR